MSASAPSYPAEPPPPRRTRRGGVVGPLVLIFLGGVFLLQNMHYLPPNFWLNLWRLWPLVLVLAGIELLLAHRIPWLVLTLLAIAVLVIGGAVANRGLPRSPAPAAATRTLRTDLGGATQASVTVRLGAGELDVGPLLEAEPTALASLMYDGPEDAVPVPRYSVSAGGPGRLEYQLGGRGAPGFMPFLGDHSNSTRMRLELNPDVPITTLVVQAGATDARLDLASLKVQNLDLSVGAAATTVRLPQINGTSTAHVSGGASTMTIDVPQGVAASIRYRGGLSGITVDPGRFPLVSQGLYQSPDYASAESKVDVTLETGLAAIQVK